VTRASELVVLARRLRAEALAGAEFDLAQMLKLEALADEALCALELPANVPDKPAVMDLALLSDTQLHELEVLVSIATGETPPEPLPAAPPEPEPTWRHQDAAELADILNHALGVKVPGNTSATGDEVACDEETIDHIRSALHKVLYPLSAARVFGHAEIEARAHAAQMRAAGAEKRAEEAEARAQRAEHQLSLAEPVGGRGGRDGNVVPLVRRPDVAF
jgi:hypothetical protein